MPRRVQVDTTEAQSFEAVAPGPYQMAVDEITDPAKSEKGNMMVEVYLAFQNPEIARKAGRVRRFYTISGKGAGFFREFWKAVTGEDIPMDAQFDIDLDQAIGKRVTAQVGNETYEGRLQNTIEKVVAE